MPNAIKHLEGLVRTAIARIRALEEENALLKKQVESYSIDREKLMKAGKGAAGGEEARRKLKKRLARLCDKIEKAASPQGFLFSDLDDE